MQRKKETDTWDGQERRSGVYDRRRPGNRRSSQERREDRRTALAGGKRSFKNWLRSMTRPRLGVDRRKGFDRRRIKDRRRQDLANVLTAEEIALLLKNQ